MEQFLEDFIYNVERYVEFNNNLLPTVVLSGKNAKNQDLYNRFEQALKYFYGKYKTNGKKVVWFLQDFDLSFCNDKSIDNIVFLCNDNAKFSKFFSAYPKGNILFCGCVLGAKHDKNINKNLEKGSAYISDVFLQMCNLSLVSNSVSVINCQNNILPIEDALEIDEFINNPNNGIFVFSDALSEDFKRLQRLQLKLLDELDRVCRENGIEYSLAGGTLLGACRHGGFIPWDYDIDVMMSPENFRKFCRLSNKFGKEYFLQTPKTDSNNHFFTKLRLNGTKMTTPMTDKLNIHNGIFIDIFEHSYTADTLNGQKIHFLLTKTFRSLVYNKWNGSVVKGAKGQELGRFASVCATVLKNVLPMTLLEKIQFFAIDFFKKPKKYMYDGMGQNLNRGAFPSKWLSEKTTLEFEGKKYPVPKEYKKYLKFLYGDYMKLPPCCQRHISHEIVNLDFGKYK